MKIKQIHADKNKSKFFLLPLTFVPANYFEKAINCYAFNAHRPELTNHVFVVFDKDLMLDFELNRLQVLNTFESMEEFGELLVVTFKLQPLFEKDHSLFVNGKYSKYSDKAKSAIKQHLPQKVLKNGKYVQSDSFKILYPCKEDRLFLGETLGVTLEDEAEIYDIPDLEQETFRISKFYNLFHTEKKLPQATIKKEVTKI